MENELEETRASSEGQLERQKKMNDQVSAAPRKAEELPGSSLTEWQSEKTFLQKAMELLQQTMGEKQRKRSERKREISSSIDKLEQRLTEMSENKPEVKKCCFSRLFKYFGYE